MTNTQSYIVAVDSCRISIPLDECKVIDTNLTELIAHSQSNAATGEHLKETFKVGSPHIRDNKNTDGTYFKIFLEKSQMVYINGEQHHKPFITVLLNSKQLTKDYFDKIHKDNFKVIYDIIMNENVFKCSYESFQNARYNDSDICFDFKSTPEEFEVFKTNLRKSAIDDSFFHSVSKTTNSGIWTPTKKKPREQATPKRPFIKAYSKQIDMETESYNFAQAYLQPSQYKDVYRFEVTIINSVHKRRLGIDEAKTIWDFLNLDLKSVLIQIVKEYFTEHKLIKAQGLMPNHYIMLNLMNMLIQDGRTRAEIMSAFEIKNNGCSSNSNKNALATYHKIISSEEIDKEKLDLNETSKNVFGFLGIDKKESIG